MTSKTSTRKVDKKQRRCVAIIQSECGIDSSTEPTCYLGILNAGLSTGLGEERVLETATPHGQIRQLVMLPNKSYCFLECCDELNAAQIFQQLHNIAEIGQNGATIFLAYFKQLPATAENAWKKAIPAGLIVLTDFVSAVEEEALLLAVRTGDDMLNPQDPLSTEQKLKHRRVKHFGYEFLYGVNNVNPQQPLEEKIPVVCDTMWPRIQRMIVEKGLTMDWKVPDQLTVNEYEPGQGIPPHVDTHSAFLDPILSLSLQADVVMEFRRGLERVPVFLPRRSLLVMGGEARYDWMHGITPRFLDIVPTAAGTLTSLRRRKRTSLTFRCLRRGPCNCSFPTLCDTRIQVNSNKPPPALEEVAVSLEQLNVHSVYEQIASHFSETRHTPWPNVASFLNSFSPGSVVLDVGCGNGKYLNCNPEILTIGCDRSHGLLSVGAAKQQNVFRCDCLHVPIRTQSVDGCISIAVIHHLSTPERRLLAISEMARLLRPGGRALIYVWAKDQCVDAKKSTYLLQNTAINKEKITEEQQRQVTAQQLQHHSNQLSFQLPIHTNRTDFLQQDVLVPWKLKGAQNSRGQEPTTFLRYYHVFEQQELQELVEKVPEVKLLQHYYDQGNHCVMFERK